MAASDAGEVLPLLVPAILLSFFIVATDTLVCLHQPLKLWLPWIGITGLSSCVLFLWRLAGRGRLTFVAMLAAAIAAAWVVFAVRLGQTFPFPTMSAHMDSWCYSAVAEYLTDHARGTVGGLGVTDQWSSHLSNTRFASPCLIALGRLLGDPIDAQSCVLWFVIAANVGAVAAFMRTCGLGLKVALGGSAFAVIAGWHGTAAITVGNFDNLIFIAEACGAITALLAWSRTKLSTPAFISIFALQVASMIMTYPEGTALLGVLCFPWAVHLTVKYRRQRGRLGFILAAIVLAGLLSSTYLPVIHKFFGVQLSLSTTIPGNRPGDHNFDGLLTNRFLGAAFCSGEEYPGAAFSLLGTLWAILLVALWIDGIRRLRHTLPWYPWLGLSFLGLLIWQGAMAKYEYGVYKILFCACWWIFTAIAVALYERLGPRGCLVAFGIGIISSSWLQVSTIHQRVWQQKTSATSLKELSHLRPWLKDRSVVISLTDDFQQMWATLMLRGTPLAVERPAGSLDMPHVRALVAQAAPLPSDRPVLRLDRPGLSGELIHSAHFALYAGKRAYISAIENPNGLENVDGMPFMWIANHAPSRLQISVPKAGLYRLSCTKLAFGPSISQGGYRDLEIIHANEKHLVRITPDSIILPPIHFDSGPATVTLRCTNLPEIFQQPNGDSRELLIGITSITIESVPDGAASSL